MCGEITYNGEFSKGAVGSYWANSALPLPSPPEDNLCLKPHSD